MQYKYTVSDFDPNVKLISILLDSKAMV